MEKEVELNGKQVSQEVLEEKKKEAEEQPGMTVVEVSKDKYRTKLED